MDKLAPEDEARIDAMVRQICLEGLALLLLWIRRQTALWGPPDAALKAAIAYARSDKGRPL